MTDPNESRHDEHADDAMRNLFSHVSREEAESLMDEVGKDLTEAEKKAYLKRWGK